MVYLAAFALQRRQLQQGGAGSMIMMFLPGGLFDNLDVPSGGNRKTAGNV